MDYPIFVLEKRESDVCRDKSSTKKWNQQINRSIHTYIHKIIMYKFSENSAVYGQSRNQNQERKIAPI